MRVRGLLLWIVLMAGFIGLLARPAWWAFNGPINPTKGEKARQAKASAQRGSWWIAAPRDGFTKLAESKFPQPSTGPALKEWVDHVA